MSATPTAIVPSRSRSGRRQILRTAKVVGFLAFFVAMAVLMLAPLLWMVVSGF